MTPIEQTVSLPSYTGLLQKWMKEGLRSAEQVDSFLEFAQFFFNREVHDCRSYVDGKKVDGSFVKGTPLLRQILKGTVEERRKGFFVSDDQKEDDTPFSNIQPYTMSIPVTPVLCETRERVGEHHVVSPRDLAYQMWTNYLGIGPCERIFILRGIQGPENVHFFFPTRWGGRKNSFIVFTIDSRYYDWHCFLFEGDPGVYAAQHKRSPRNAEFDIYVQDREKWPAHEAPVILPLTWENGWVNPRPVEVRDISQVAGILKSLQAEYGPYLWGGGA